MKKNKQKIIIALQKLLSPLIRILLRYEITHGEFEEMARRAYVNVAFKDFALPNKKQTISRVSLITGLSRVEVARLAEVQETSSDDHVSLPNRATRVVGGWMSDKNFLDANATPRILPIKNQEHCFEDLVYRYSGGVTPRAVLDELLRVGVAERVDDSYVRLLRSGYLPDQIDGEKASIVLTHAKDLLSTGVNNIEGLTEVPYFQRQLTFVDVPEEVKQNFEAICRDKGGDLLVSLNQWLTEKCNEAGENTDNKEIAKESQLHRVGLGIYFLNEKIEE